MYVVLPARVNNDALDCFFFFFQAEDGIRDFCLSRGLGLRTEHDRKSAIAPNQSYPDMEIRKHQEAIPAGEVKHQE